VNITCKANNTHTDGYVYLIG